MANEKVDVTQEGAFHSSNLSPRREADFCELVWENGHIMMQGQSSKIRKSPFSTCDFQSLHNSQDSKDVNGLKTSKLGSMDSLFGEMGLGQDVDMGPWFSYPVEDHMDDDYTCGFLPELSGISRITINDFSTDNSRRVDGASKGVSSSVKHDIPRSGVSDITSGGLNASSLCAFTSLRLQKLDAGQPSTSSSFTNFPFFSRPAIIAKGNHGTVNTSKRSENDSTLVDLVSDCTRKEIGSHNQSVQAAFNEISGSLLNKPTEEDAFDVTKGKMEMNGEKNKEPILTASSVCSGNSVDRVSNERGYDLKRKSRETTESEGPSDEVEEESVGAKKSAHARASSKRSRAAEVHNLSERKRRDRINEKMRALQELIPNCNKVDKASMLDEAIEYLKTLQLQVQMLSMGTGMYMQPMMFSPGMQPSYGQQMPHFSTMGIGMGMGMGIGMGFGMNMVPYQNPHYPVPGAPSPFQGMPGHSLPSFGHQSMQQAPSHPNSGTPPLNTPVGLNISSVVGSSGASAKHSSQQVRPSNVPNNLMNPVVNQATMDGIQMSPLSRDRKQNDNASKSSLAARKTNNKA